MQLLRSILIFSSDAVFLIVSIAALVLAVFRFRYAPGLAPVIAAMLVNIGAFSTRLYMANVDHPSIASLRGEHNLCASREAERRSFPLTSPFFHPHLFIHIFPFISCDARHLKLSTVIPCFNVTQYPMSSSY